MNDEQLTELERAIAKADESSTPYQPDVNYPAFVAGEIAPLVRSWLNEAWAQGYNAHAAGHVVVDPTEVPF